MIRKIIFLFSLCTVFPTYASICNSYERDKASHFAEIQGREVVEQYQGGNRINTSITSCEYNTYTGKYNIEIDVSWYGVISGKDYNSRGKMTMDSNGNHRNYNETYRNGNLKDYAFWRGIGVLVLAAGAASAESERSSSQSNQGYYIWVSNHCGRTVDLIISFKDANDDLWKTDGKWSFINEQSSFLASNNIRLKTKNSKLYYAISPSFSSLGLSHNDVLSYDGRVYESRKVIDEEGDTEVYLCRD